MNHSNNRIPIFDIHVASYLEMKGVSPQLVMRSGKIVFEFELSDAVFDLLREYEQNTPIPILNYVGVLRRLRSRMFYLKNQDKTEGGRS